MWGDLKTISEYSLNKMLWRRSTDYRWYRSLTETQIVILVHLLHSKIESVVSVTLRNNLKRLHHRWAALAGLKELNSNFQSRDSFSSTFE